VLFIRRTFTCTIVKYIPMPHYFLKLPDLFYPTMITKVAKTFHILYNYCCVSTCVFVCLYVCVCLFMGVYILSTTHIHSDLVISNLFKQTLNQPITYLSICMSVCLSVSAMLFINLSKYYIRHSLFNTFRNTY